jgi:hypothetical protein
MKGPVHQTEPGERDESDIDRRAFLAAIAAASLVTASARTFAMVRTHLPTGRITDFDFLRGHWKVKHRAFAQQRWQEFEGEVTSRPLLAGQTNIDDNIWTWNGNTYRGLAVRVFDPKSSRWSIFWLDGRSPERFGPPAVGGFSGNKGTFYGDEESQGKPVRVRLSWFIDGADHARWEQAYSSDNEATWQPNWLWFFERTAST